MGNDGAKFGAVAATFEQRRPPIPDEALVWLTRGDPHRVLDLAAGTGRLTRRLRTRVPAIDTIVSADHDPVMLEQLRLDCPDSTVIACSAEDLTPLAGRTFDAVYVVGGWQWFDPDRALPQIHSVLDPGGVLGVLWCVWDNRVPWVAQAEKALPPTHWSWQPPGSFSIPRWSGFTQPARHELNWLWPITADDAERSAATYSTVLRLPTAEQATHLAAVRRIFDQRVDDTGFVRIPIRTICYRSLKTAVPT